MADEKEHKVLSAGEAREELKKGETITLGGRTFKRPEKAAEKIEEAFRLVAGALKKNLIPNLDEQVAFKEFQGNIVGESTPEVAFIDASMLMHPATRLAQVIGHELAHAGATIENEALVETYVEEVLNTTNYTREEVYQTSIDRFGEFAARFDPSGNRKSGTITIYELFNLLVLIII